jgi:hypothetical protein
LIHYNSRKIKYIEYMIMFMRQTIGDSPDGTMVSSPVFRHARIAAKAASKGSPGGWSGDTGVDVAMA